MYVPFVQPEPLFCIEMITMEQTIINIEEVCELLVELAALQHLRNVWSPTNSEDQHQIERYILLEKLISKKEEMRCAVLEQVRQQDPELEQVITKLAQERMS